MEKLKNLGITIKEKMNVIVERAKTDKKFLAALIGGVVAVVAIILALLDGAFAKLFEFITKLI